MTVLCEPSSVTQMGTVLSCICQSSAENQVDRRQEEEERIQGWSLVEYVTEHLTRECRSGVHKHEVRVSGENEAAEVSWDPEW